MTATMRRLAAIGTAAAAALAFAAACNSSRPPDDEGAYLKEIADARAAKDATFRTDSGPVPASLRAKLVPLAYFPIEPGYRVPAALRPPPAAEAGASDRPGLVLDMATSTGAMRQMRRVGTLEFTLNGQALHLTAFVEVGARDLDHLFVPFRDQTTGGDTYGGGRYLDLDRNATGIYEMDFNRAYQPYCYFNPTFECPFPPAENLLPVPIRAGERLKSSKQGASS